MTPSLEASDIAVRLLATVVCTAALGLNRGLRGHAAGLRTTILVGLSASLAMILANLLLSTHGRAPDAFATMDPMRLPLGVLTGVGFIGGGAILRRGEFVTGVATAATLWIATLIGLCHGSGEIWLGLAGTALAVFVLWPLRWIDNHLPREQSARLTVTANATTRFEDLARCLARGNYRPRLLKVAPLRDQGRLEFQLDIAWKRPEAAGPPLDIGEFLGEAFRLESLEFTSETSD